MILKDNQHEDFSVKLLDKTLNDKNSDVSKKNALLNQRIAGHLKHKKAISSKPLRVVLDDDKSTVAKNVIIEDDGGDTLSLPLASSTPTKTQPSELSSTEHSTSTAPSSIEPTQSTLNESNDTIDQIETIVMRNPTEFNVNEQGQILNNGRVVGKSKLKTSLAHIRAGQKGKNPNGFKYLIKKLQENRQTSALLDKMTIVAPPMRKSKRAVVLNKKFTINKWA
jgi:hypothetical protein